MLELALHVLDILQNAVEAGARSVSLAILEDLPADRLLITVSDDGRGMDAETAARGTDPFYTTRSTRHVGLGLPLYRMAAEAAGGSFRLRSAPGQGTTIEAEFGYDHPDRQPLGDMGATLLAFLLASRPVRLKYEHRVISAPGKTASFGLDTEEIRAALGDVPFNVPAVTQWLEAFLEEGEAELRE